MRAALSHCGSSDASPAAVALAQADAVPLREAIERAPVNAEELSRQLLVPARLAQHAVNMARHDSTEAERRSRRVGGGHRPDTLLRQVLRTDDRARRQGDGALDGVLQLTDVPGPVVADH